MSDSQVQLIQDISTRVKAMQDEQSAVKEKFSEAYITQLVTTHLATLTDDDPVVRKFRGWGGSNDSRLVGSKYGRWGLNAADIEYLYDLQSSLAGKMRANGGAHPGPSEDLRKAFDAVSDAYYLTEEQAREIDRKAIDDLYPRIPKADVMNQFRSKRAYERWRQGALGAAYAAIEAPDYDTRAATMDTAQTGFGLQLVGAQYVGDMWDAAFQDGRIAPLIPTFEMTAPVAYLPVAVDMPKMLFVSESTSDVLATAQYTAVRTGSNRVTVTAKKFVIHQVWSGEMEEDSIVPFIPFLRNQAARGLSFWTDFVVLNGDDTNAGTGNINSDDADPADTEPYLAFDGIRHAAIVDNTGNIKNAAGSALTLSMLRDVRGLMRDETRYVDFGHPNDQNDLIFVADPDTGDRIATLDEIIEAKVTRGPQAQLLNGQVTSFLGHPVITTMAQQKTDSDYKYTTTSPTTADVYGQVTAFNRNAFVIGWRRRIRTFTEIIGASDQGRIVYSLRLGFGRFTPTGAASGIEGSAIVGYIGL